MAKDIFCWFFAFVFFVLGVLNIIFVHPVPSLIYLLFAIIYLPHFNSFLKKKLGVLIPFMFKVIFFVLIMWGTLGVSDLVEIFEDWWLS